MGEVERFEILAHIGSHVNENETNMKFNNFEKRKKCV